MRVPSTPCSENTERVPRNGRGGRGRTETDGGNREGRPPPRKPPRQRKCVSLSAPQSILGTVVKWREGGAEKLTV